MTRVGPIPHESDVPDWDDLPSRHPLSQHLHQMSEDLMGVAANTTGMHPANMAAIVITEWLTAYINEELPPNVRNYCHDVAVAKAQARRHMQTMETREQLDVAAQRVAAHATIPDDISGLD